LKWFRGPQTPRKDLMVSSWGPDNVYKPSQSSNIEKLLKNVLNHLLGWEHLLFNIKSTLYD